MAIALANSDPPLIFCPKEFGGPPPGMREWCLGMREWYLGMREWCLGMREWCLGMREWCLGMELVPGHGVSQNHKFCPKRIFRPLP